MVQQTQYDILEQPSPSKASLKKSLFLFITLKELKTSAEILNFDQPPRPKRRTDTCKKMMWVQWTEKLQYSLQMKMPTLKNLKKNLKKKHKQGWPNNSASGWIWQQRCSVVVRFLKVGVFLVFHCRRSTVTFRLFSISLAHVNVRSCFSFLGCLSNGVHWRRLLQVGGGSVAKNIERCTPLRNKKKTTTYRSQVNAVVIEK